MGVLEGLWVAGIVFVVLASIVAVALIGGLALQTGFRRVEANRRTG
jgi:hypothetical protein